MVDERCLEGNIHRRGHIESRQGHVESRQGLQMDGGVLRGQ